MAHVPAYSACWPTLIAYLKLKQKEAYDFKDSQNVAAMRPVLLTAALLLLASPAFATLGDNGMTTYTGRAREENTLVFGNQLVIDSAVDLTLNTSQQIKTGTWQPSQNDPPTEKKVLNIECLNSVAPEPLNWHMWCPGKDAKVEGWTDKSGAAHRTITIRPQHNMTAHMALWFINTHLSGLLPPTVEFQGNHYYYYHLWHPLDHIESAWSCGPVNPLIQKGLPIYTLIHERYRNPTSWPYKRHYETNGWFYVKDPIQNLMKNRIVITMPLLGLPTWTMIVEFNDTPEGMVVAIEIIAGIPAKGYDKRNPMDGYVTAAGMNELLTAPLVAQQRQTPDWEGAIDAITRHTIEEFTNLQFFVPTMYKKYCMMGALGINWIPSIDTFMKNNNKTALDVQTVSFYNVLSAIARKQVDISKTPKGALVNETTDAARHKYKAMTDAASTAVEAKSKATYVPISNAVTKAAYEHNKANGAHPEQDVGFNTLVDAFKGFKSKFMGSSSSSKATPTQNPNPSKPNPTQSGVSSEGKSKSWTSWFGNKVTISQP